MEARKKQIEKGENTPYKNRYKIYIKKKKIIIEKL